MRILKGTRRHMNSYNMYVKENYPKFKENYETSAEAINALAIKWKMMGPGEKKIYKIKADEDNVKQNSCSTRFPFN